MSKTVRQYPVKRDRLYLPEGAEILEFVRLDQDLFVCALVDVDEFEDQYRDIVILGRGDHTNELNENYRFIGTFRRGNFVLHAFEILP